MKTYTERLQDLWEEMRIEVRKKVRENGTESDFTLENTIKVNCLPNKDLGNGGTLVEIGEDTIYDNDGYAYNYGELDYEGLSELVDYLNL